ncbi:MAG: TRAP transporter substrate-binding protein [Candidatus Hodarchaeota archaeon]
MERVKWTVVTLAMFLIVCVGVPSSWGWKLEKPLIACQATKTGSIWDKDLRKFAKLIEERTDGAVKIKVFPGKQLGGAKDLLEGIKIGTVDLTLTVTTYMSIFEPAYKVVDFHFIFRDRDHAWKCLDGNLGRELNKLIGKRGFKVLGYGESGWRDMHNNRGPIYTPSDLKGVKIRVRPAPINVEMFKALGASPTPMPWVEVYTSMQQGIIDAFDCAIWGLWELKLYEIVKYSSFTHHQYAPTALVISNKKFDSFPRKIKKIFLDTAKEVNAAQRETVVKNDKKYQEQCEGKGMKFNKVSDKEPFYTAVKPVITKYAKEYQNLVDIIEKTK